MRIPKDRTRLMRVLLAVLVLVMILDVAACLRSIGYWGAAEIAGPLAGFPRWGISLDEARLFLTYRMYNPNPEGFYCDEYAQGRQLDRIFECRPFWLTYLCNGVPCWILGIPLFPLALLCLVLWAFLFRKQRQRRRLLAWMASGPRCHSCDYNLTGNTSGICPECGTPIPDEVKEEVKITPADDPAG